MNYYQRLKDVREDNDKTQKESAEYLNMDQSNYAKYENGKNMMRDLEKFCDRLKLVGTYAGV